MWYRSKVFSWKSHRAFVYLFVFGDLYPVLFFHGSILITTPTPRVTTIASIESSSLVSSRCDPWPWEEQHSEHNPALKEPRGKVNSQSVQMMLAKGVQGKECSMGWKKHADLLVGRWLVKGSWKGEQFNRIVQERTQPRQKAWGRAGLRHPGDGPQRVFKSNALPYFPRAEVLCKEVVEDSRGVLRRMWWESRDKGVWNFNAGNDELSVKLEGGDGTSGSNSRQAKVFLFLAEALSTAVIFLLFYGGWGSPAFLYLAGLQPGPGPCLLWGGSVGLFAGGGCVPGRFGELGNPWGRA